MPYKYGIARNKAGLLPGSACQLIRWYLCTGWDVLMDEFENERLQLREALFDACESQEERDNITQKLLMGVMQRVAPLDADEMTHALPLFDYGVMVAVAHPEWARGYQDLILRSFMGNPLAELLMLGDPTQTARDLTMYVVENAPIRIKDDD